MNNNSSSDSELCLETHRTIQDLEQDFYALVNSVRPPKNLRLPRAYRLQLENNLAYLNTMHEIWLDFNQFADHLKFLERTDDARLD